MLDQLSLFGPAAPSVPAVPALDPVPEEGNNAVTDFDEFEPVRCAGPEVGDYAVREILKRIERGECYFDHSFSGCFTNVLDIIEPAILWKEEEYMERIKKLKPQAVQVCVEVLGLLMDAMYMKHAVEDILGRVYMEVASRWKQSGLGQFFTPPAICEMMCRMNLGDVKAQVLEYRARGERIRVMEPCVGSGAMILAMKKVILEEAGYVALNQYEFYGMDVDETCCKMAKIQLALTDYRWMRSRLIVAAHDAIEQSTEAV